MSDNRDRRSDAELIETADALEAMTQSRGWQHVLQMAEDKRKSVLEALTSCDPANVGQVARLQAQALELMTLPRMVQEAIHRGHRARERVRRRGGDG